MGEEVSCLPLLLPLHSSFFALVLEMAIAIRFSFFLFCCFVVVFYVLVYFSGRVKDATIKPVYITVTLGEWLTDGLNSLDNSKS